MNYQRNKSIYSLTKKQLVDVLLQHKLSPHVASLILDFLYKKKSKQKLSESTWSLLKKHFSFHLPEIVKVQKSSDGTHKFLLRLEDGLQIETVLIPFPKRYSVCISTQVGCAMKCSFCYTGTNGLARNLFAHEIVGQFLVAQTYLKENIESMAVIPSIVFMGQGEPLHNFDELQMALSVLLENEGAALGPSQITLSTAGYLPGLKKFHLLPRINLALSLHSPFNEIRKTLIPIAAQYKLEDLLSEMDQIKLGPRQFIVYEYLLIDGLNDRVEDADELHNLFKDRRAIINLIPFNPFPDSLYKRPTVEKVETFKAMLVDRKLRTMVRTTKGSDILAACGQLNT